MGVVAAGTVLVQAHGADRRPKGLGNMLTGPGSQLLVHRPERRAVVFLPGGSGAVAGTGALERVPDGGPAPHRDPVSGGDPEDVDAYARVFRPGRTAAVVRAADLGVHLLAELPGFAAPAVLAHREDDGVVVTSALSGAGPVSIGRLLNRLTQVPVPADLPVRDAEAELAWLGVWVERVGSFLPDVPARLAPVLDVVLEHAVVDHWDPTAAELDRADAYRRLLLVRLACQYAFRPAHAHVVGDLVALVAR